jgi:UDP-N-acetylmuramoyl-tripeptide--D-alanyl-D-alanine ligase
MTLWRWDEIREAVKGQGPESGPGVERFVIDSRQAGAGCMFIALQGERLDGHDYVASALALGAEAAIVSRVPVSRVLEGADAQKLMRVGNTCQALEALAASARARARAKIVAVTGSVGKTGTKEAIRLALSAYGSVHATMGNYNNHIGLPLSLAHLPPEVAFGVFELGMNHAGEIRALTQLARPDIAVITNVEAVHLEFFDGVEGIADAKAEIMEGLTPAGSVILNRDNPWFARLAASAQRLRIARILTFGEEESADFRLIGCDVASDGTHLQLLAQGERLDCFIQATGRHWALAALAALAAVRASGQEDLRPALAALAEFAEPRGRGGQRVLHLPQGEALLLDDCYNASPASMRAGLAKLNDLHRLSKQGTRGQGGRKIAILGDMLELGAESPLLHRHLLEPLMSSGIDQAHLAGPLMRHLHEALPEDMRGLYGEDASALAEGILAQLREGDMILLKGSRGSRMDLLRDALLAAETFREKES